MPDIKLGTTTITDVRVGSTLIKEVRRGGTLVWVRSSIADFFDRDDADTMGSAWTAVGSPEYSLGVENGYARVRIPEGQLGGVFSLSISRAFFNTSALSGDNGYVECRPMSLGSSASIASPIDGYRTQVFGRVSTSGFTNGVGIEMTAGHMWICRRVSGTDARMSDGGTFQAGDQLRLTFTGNVHTLTRNGRVATTWTDSSNTVGTGSGNRRLGIRGDGAKDLLGPRRFSPALDYVVMG